MLPTLLMLVLASTPDRPSTSPGEAPAATPATPPPVAPDPESLAKLEEPPRWQGSRAQKVLPYVVGEGLILIVSALAADGPQGTGWALVAISPLAYMNMQRGGTIGYTSIFVAGEASIGFYNALELRGRRYRHGQRFWINMGAWHALVATMEVAAMGFQDKRAPESPVVAFGLGAGRPVLEFAGRF